MLFCALIPFPLQRVTPTDLSDGNGSQLSCTSSNLLITARTCGAHTSSQTLSTPDKQKFHYPSLQTLSINLYTALTTHPRAPPPQVTQITVFIQKNRC